MMILACETSTLLGSVALSENDKILSSEESMRQGSHSDVLNLFIEKVLNLSGQKLSDVDLFVSGIGPGSFTGIRISLNTIKSLAYCFNKPVIGINSLEVLATQAKALQSGKELSNYPIISMINAYKNMAYVATYKQENGQLNELKKPEVIRIQNLSGYITEKSIVCGDAYTAYEKYFPKEVKDNMLRIIGLSDEPHAKTLAQLAYQKTQQKDYLSQDWNQLVPLYLRASEAEENLLGIKYQPLI